MSLAFDHWKRFKEDPAFKARYELRSKFLAAVREFFVSEGFIETETPSMVRQCGLEPNLIPFETELIDREGVKRKRYFITSPEHHMKMLLCVGFPRIFQICKSFRNGEEGSERHNPEFSMIEWYRTEADYTDIMNDMEKLFRFVCQKLLGTTTFTYQGMTIDLSKSWERITVEEAFAKHAGIDNLLSLSRDEFAANARAIDIVTDNTDSWDDIFYRIFLSRIESQLGNGVPTILCDYPGHMAALAIQRGKVCERYEAYIAGLELCNAFSELCDAKEQRERFEEERIQRITEGKSELPMAEDFLRALEEGMPRAGGNALGLDRMFMLFTDQTDIRQTLPFADFWE